MSSFPANIGRGYREALDLLFPPPKRGHHGSSFVIPAGDRYSSRGQRPRKARPQRRPTLKGSNSCDAPPVSRPPPTIVRPLQGRITCVTLSGGVAPGYCMAPLQGTKKRSLLKPLHHPFLTPRRAEPNSPCSVSKFRRISLAACIFPHYLSQTPALESHPEVPGARGNHCARDTCASRSVRIGSRTHKAASLTKGWVSWRLQKHFPGGNAGGIHRANRAPQIHHAPPRVPGGQPARPGVQSNTP